MRFVRLFEIVVYSYIISTIISNVNSQSLVSGPEGAQVRIGSDVVFNCKATYDTNVYTLFWKNETRYLTRGYQLYSSVSPSKYFVSFISLSYRLTLSNVQLSDAGLYECRLGYKNENYAFAFQPNPATAKLTVHQPPSVTSPNCFLKNNAKWIDPDTPLYTGESIRLHCISEDHGSTSPNLIITISGVNVAESIVRDVIDYKWVKSNEIIIERNDTELTCYLDSEALEETRNCTIRLNVLLPDVEIKPKLLSVQETDTIHFQCSARNLKTTNLTYEWQVSPYIPGDMFTSMTSILNITDLQLKNTLLLNQLFIITCFVRENGMIWNSSATLNILRRQIYTIPTTLLNNDQDISISINGPITELDNSKSGPKVGVILGVAVIAISVILLIVVFLNRQKLHRTIFSNKSVTSETLVNDTQLYEVIQRNIVTTNIDKGGDTCDDVYYSSIPNQIDVNNCDINTQVNDEVLYENRPFTQDIEDMLNAEGLNYAELDLRTTTSCDIIDKDQSITYATLQT